MQSTANKISMNYFLQSGKQRQSMKALSASLLLKLEKQATLEQKKTTC